MKKALALRVVAVVAMLLLASTLSGCIASKLVMEVKEPLLVCTQNEPIVGTLVITAKGIAGGVYNKLIVEFKDGAGDVIEAATQEANVQVFVSPFNSPVEVDISESVVAPVELWDSEGNFQAVTAKFTLPAPSTFLKTLTAEVDVGPVPPPSGLQ
ncbi:MAG: hypothetical protein NUW23_08445 [Firmicutes bacterium]|nr:hypothetical protein [Bacillota bacterium]